jgi:excisionase family DNA binding protein
MTWLLPPQQWSCKLLTMQPVAQPEQSTWMPVCDARRVLHVSEWTVYRMIQGGKLRAARPGHRWLVRREDVERMLLPAG